MIMKQKTTLIYLIGMFLCLNLSISASSLPDRQISPEKTIWYTYPAKDWATQCLHIGNGYMGGSFYGEIEKEHFDIAEKTFWTGGPNVTPNYNYGIIEGGNKQINHIRKAIIDGQIAVADSLARTYMAGNYDGFGAFSKVGSLQIEFANHRQPVTEYIRGLDMSQSLGFVQYKMNDITFQREYLCSYPDKVMALHFSSDAKGQINFTVCQDMLYKVESVNITDGNELVIDGLIDGSGLGYCARIKIINDGGEVTTEWGKLTVTNANSATILYTVDTEYDADSPTFKGVNPHKETEEVMARIAKEPYSSIKERHIQDYRNLFDRVSFSLAGDCKLEQLPTNERIEQLKKGMTDDSALKSLFFNFGRYLLISASRPGTLPSTLVGVWNNSASATWSANYQSNINVQEMYWGCGPTNLPECQEAYIDWIEGLVEPGRKAAQAYYGTKGWVSHATGNIWKYVAPGTELMWGLYPMGAAWHCRHVWDQYDFTRDLAYLKEKAYPIMKEAALFCLENMALVDGKYVMIPAVSAEHGIEMNDGIPVAYSTSNGEVNTNKLYLHPAFQDIEMVYDLYSNVISAAEILRTDKEFRSKLIAAKNKLTKLKIGKYGQLQEWLLDADNPRDHHRHIAHLYGVYPGNMISLSETPELFEAAKKSLNMRSEGLMQDRWPHAGGNWSMAWRMACWARLLDGERASKIHNLLIKDTGYENLMTSQSGVMGVDATMATPGIFAEMIMQSHNGSIHLLPALPTEWPEGEVKGLIARGGYKLNIQWKYGQLIKVELFIPKGMAFPTLFVNNKKLDRNDPRIHL